MARNFLRKTENPAEWHYGLNEQERRFVEEYMIDLNGTKSMMRCGMENKDSARNFAATIRKRPQVRAAIERLMDERGVSRLRVLEEYAKVAFANLGDFVRIERNGTVSITPHDDLSEDQLAALQEISEVKNDDGSVSVKVKTSDKLQALTYLGKAMGMFVERSEVSGPNGGPIAIDSYEAKNRLRDLLELKAEPETPLIEAKPDAD